MPYPVRDDVGRLWSGEYRPLRIVAHMAGPIAMMPQDALPLDGILEFAAFRAGWPPVLQYGEPHHPLPRIDSSDPANFVLPVKRIGHKCDPDWYWSASWITFPQGFETDRQHWNKRFDGGRSGVNEYLTFGERSAKIGVSSGRYKGHHRPISLMLAPVAEWFAFGAADGIIELLRGITHIGHKRSQGYGEVIRWEVWPAKADWSCWRDGEPMRAIPTAETAGHTAYHAVRAPHWHVSRRRLCLVPAR